MNRNKKVVSINKYNYNLAARREQLRKERREKIRSNILIGIAGLNMFLMMVMMLSAIFIDYTDRDKNIMLLMLAVAGVCLIAENPKAAINFIKESFSFKDIREYLYVDEEEEYDDED